MAERKVHIQLGKELDSIIRENKDAVEDDREQIILDALIEFKTLKSFRLSLQSHVITASDDVNLDRICELYARTHSWSEEELKYMKEKYTPYSDLNSSYGPMQGMWVFLSHPDSSIPLAASYLSMSLFVDQESNSVATMHETRVVVPEAYRRLRLEQELLRRTKVRFISFFCDSKPEVQFDHPSMYIFQEQPDPLGMTAEEYIAETIITGKDPCDTLKGLQGQNYRKLHFNNTQSQLSNEYASPTSLLIRTSEGSVPSSLVFEHLQRYNVVFGREDANTNNREIEAEIKSIWRVPALNMDYSRLKKAIGSLVLDGKEFFMPVGDLLQSRGIRTLFYR